MKIALILSGQVRCFEKCSDSQKKFLIDDLNADVFCHFWDTADLKPNIRSVVSKERIPDYIHLKDDNNLKNKLLSLYKPKKYIIEPQVKFNNTRFSFRMISMYYSMQKAYLLCRKYGFYDCIIRCRTDLFFQKPFLIEWLNNLHYVYCLEFGNGYCQDTFAFGPMKYMDIYYNTYNYICDDLFKGNDCGPECVLTENLKINKVPIKFLNNWYKNNEFYIMER